MSVDTHTKRRLLRPRGLAVGLIVSLLSLVTLTSATAGARGTAAVSDHGRLQVNGNDFGSSAANDLALPCGFNVSFFGYDVGVEHAAISLTPELPTVGGQPLSLRVTWQTSTRTSMNQLDQNVVISPSLIENTFATSTTIGATYHAMITVQINGQTRSNLVFHSVWIDSCNALTPVSPVTNTSSANAVPGTNPSSAVLAIVVDATQRIGGTSAPFRTESTRLVTGEQLQFRINVVNTGNATLNVAVIDPRCDPLTLSPSSPQTLSPGQALTFFCSHVFFTAPAKHRVLNVATIKATSLQGANLAPVNTATTAFVFWPHDTGAAIG